MSALTDILYAILPRFRPNHPNAPANTFVFGFITPEGERCSCTISRTQTTLTHGVQSAEYLIYATTEVITAILNAETPNRAALVEQLTMRPDYPFNNYLLSIFLNAFDLAIPDLDYSAKRFDGPFPFPPRYPASENVFRLRQYEAAPLPVYSRDALPELIAEDHPLWVAMHDKAWQIACKNLRQPEPDSGFVANFIDPAFSPNTYLWDSCFMMLFGRYGRRLFDFIGTLDNFYAKQQDDGFICREINTYTGASVFQSLDPRSTGPNIFAWCEWLWYEVSGDKERLKAIFPVLIACHRWWKDWRTHPDGGYWTSGWGSGMDNQTRVPHSEYHHRHYAWVDASMQQALNCRMLLNIAVHIDRHEFDSELTGELQHLTGYINTKMWDEGSGFYFDRAPDGRLSKTKSIGAYWGLLSEAVPQDRAENMIAHLENPTSFNRPHRIPTQAYDSEDYNPYGGYWLGSVWSPTNYMTLRGLTMRGCHQLAHEIALNHVENIAQVFADTGTLWENYAPEYVQPGKPAGREFVGWTGVSAISIPIEYLIGLQTVSGAHDLQWTIRLTERHGVLRYPIGVAHDVDLICEQRGSRDEPATVMISAREPLRIEIIRGDQCQSFALEAGEHQLQI